MSVKMICDRCHNRYDAKSWYGYIYEIHTEDGQLKGFHICRKCQDEWDTVMADKLKTFLKIQDTVIDWAVYPCNKV